MSSGKHVSVKSGANLELYKFPILSPDEIVSFSATFKEQLFGACSKDDRCEVNPVSGYISYTKAIDNRAATKNGGNNLPQTEAQALEAALAFLAEKYVGFSKEAKLQSYVQQVYNQGKPLKPGFAPIPNPDWLKPIEIYPVAIKEDGQADHWLCKFEIELPVKNTKVKLLNAWIDVRVGGAPVSECPNDFEIVGFNSQFRPLVNVLSKPMEKFLPDTGNPNHIEDEAASEHGIHIGGETLICYIQADGNSPQFNLLPYEITAEGGHHLNILPASKESLWVEFSSNANQDEIEINALIMGGSGDYEAKWGFWKTFGGMSEAEELVNTINSKRGTLQHSSAFDGVAISNFSVPKGIWDVGISVYDKQNHNVIHKVVSLTVNPFSNSSSSIVNFA